MSGIPALRGLFEQHQDDDAPQMHPIEPQAQATELRDRFRRATTAAALVPGMLCREKLGMTVLKSPGLIMFWRWLDPSYAQDALIIADSVHKKYVNRTDCMVGFLDHGGGLVVLNFESWRLEPSDEFTDDTGMSS